MPSALLPDRTIFSSPRKMDQENFERLLPLAYQWAKIQETFILERGIPLGPRYSADARHVGVQDCSRVKVLIVDRIPMPENEELAEAARRRHIITDTSRGVTIGHGIIIRADYWGDRLVPRLPWALLKRKRAGLPAKFVRPTRLRSMCDAYALWPSPSACSLIMSKAHGITKSEAAF